MKSDSSVKDSLELLSKRWMIDPEIYDLHLGKRNDVVDTALEVNRVIFHIPTLTADSLYVLWRCMWPDCHNCCERQGRLPLTKDDIEIIAKKTCSTCGKKTQDYPVFCYMCDDYFCSENCHLQKHAKPWQKY